MLSWTLRAAALVLVLVAGRTRPALAPLPPPSPPYSAPRTYWDCQVIREHAICHAGNGTGRI